MHLRSLLLLASLLPPAAAQGTEWVTNGTFTGTLAPWVMGGAYSVNPGLEIGWDTTGLGVSDSYGVNAGGQVSPPPYPPNTLEQQVFLIAGLNYEFRADASGARPGAPTVNNGDIGTIWVEVDNVEVARFAFGGYTAGETKRAQICGRFTPTNTGNLTVRIFFQRIYLTNVSTPRMNLDNVSIRDVAGPTFWIATNRRIGAASTWRVAGNAGATYASFISAGQLGTGMALPGVNGLWYLDLANTVMMSLGVLDGAGNGNYQLQVPALSGMLTVPFYYQAGTATAGVLDLGFHFGVVFTQ